MAEECRGDASEEYVLHCPRRDSIGIVQAGRV